MQAQQSYSRNTNIIHQFTATSGTGLKILYQPSSTNRYDRVDTLKFYGFITSLRLMIDISSVSEAPIPDISDVASSQERLIAVRAMEWESPRKQLELLIKTSKTDWYRIAFISLLNREPYYHVDLMPYLTNNLSFDTGNDFLLAARIVNVGYGLLQNVDIVTVFGSVKEEITNIPTESPLITVAQPYSWSITDTSQIILNSNSQRKQVTLTNTSLDRDITINYGSSAIHGQGITLMRGGGSYEINFSNPYLGAISAISDGESTLTGIEAI